MRLLTRIPDIQDNHRANLREAIRSAESGDTNMETALQMARKSERRRRRG